MCIRDRPRALLVRTQKRTQCLNRVVGHDRVRGQGKPDQHKYVTHGSADSVLKCALGPAIAVHNHFFTIAADMSGCECEDFVKAWILPSVENMCNVAETLTWRFLQTRWQNRFSWPHLQHFWTFLPSSNSPDLWRNSCTACRSVALTFEHTRCGALDASV